GLCGRGRRAAETRSLGGGDTATGLMPGLPHLPWGLSITGLLTALALVEAPQEFQHRGRLRTTENTENTENTEKGRNREARAAHSCALRDPRHPPFFLRAKRFLSIERQPVAVEIPGCLLATAFGQMRLP